MIVGRVYDRHYLPSGHCTDKLRFAVANVGGNRYRDLRCHYLPRVYMNLSRRRSMAEAKKNSESELKMNALLLWQRVQHLESIVGGLESRIMRMERAYDALGRRLEGSERHVEDEGWFD